MHEDEPEDGAGGPGGFAALFLSPLAGHARDSGGNSPPGHCGKGAKFAQTPKVEDAAPTAILDAGVISTALQTPASIITSDAGAGGGEEMTPPELGDGGSSIRALPDVTTSGAAANTPTPVAKANTAASMTDPAAPAPAEHDDAGRHIAELAGENTGPHPPEDAGSSVARALRTDAAAQSGIKAITQT
ncbi:MAG: hypothetical protein KDA46_14540, partial [Parvularculaceae bacterium]|nr:hypothetical protein [Parvularculaceae bacterium]